jgi:Zn-dependent protease/predicted transcriptional regulator
VVGVSTTREAGVRGFRLFSIFGIEIRIDYSWFVIFFLVLWTLTRGAFPTSLPDQPPGAYIAMGLAGTLLLFASLLAHELSHSLVARSRGIEVEGITLFIFGGMARTGADFESPGDEFLIAGVGPLSSLIIAAAFWALATLGDMAGAPATVTTVAGYLATINIVLAVFNLFPGFPLDGGRLFRAIVWKATGDRRRATRYATTGGKVFGFMLLGLGILNMFAGNVVGGLWLVFIGWFVRTTAEASYTQYVLRQSLQGVRARDAMTPAPSTVPAELSLQQFLEEQIMHGRHHSFPVVRDDRTVGLITLEGVRAVPRTEWAERAVGDAMIPISDALVVRPGDDMVAVLEKIGSAPSRRLLVMQDGELHGILSSTDITRWLERQRLREEVAGTA